ncbi:MAG: hypothetical protein HOJ23_14575 [Gammaproteobacteria bacterium]|nr:hypothetical protein [Gammaproteobacteria bacterium]
MKSMTRLAITVVPVLSEEVQFDLAQIKALVEDQTEVGQVDVFAVSQDVPMVTVKVNHAVLAQKIDGVPNLLYHSAHLRQVPF